MSISSQSLALVLTT